MNLIDLEAFVSVVDHGSVVAAAASLHLTQSAVTRRIQNLEDVLGMPLLDRKTRPLQPTRAGQETYEFAKPVLSSVNDLKAGIFMAESRRAIFASAYRGRLGTSQSDRPSGVCARNSQRSKFKHSCNGQSCFWSGWQIGLSTLLLYFYPRELRHRTPLCRSASERCHSRLLRGKVNGCRNLRH
jgi:Bacterial regulatory helix-turn-helix protein, lysR family